jgi:hypothetical protein
MTKNWTNRNKRIAKDTIEWLKKAEAAILANQAGMSEIDCCIKLDYDPQTAVVFVRNCVLDFGLKSVLAQIDKNAVWPAVKPLLASLEVVPEALRYAAEMAVERTVAA